MSHALWQGVTFVVRIAVCLLGITFSLMSHFLYADEEEKLRNRLVDLWITTTATEETLGRLIVKFANKAAVLGDKLLTNLLGNSFFSLRFVAASGWLSIASGYMMAAYTLYSFDAAQSLSHPEPLVYFHAAFSLLAVITLMVIPRYAISRTRCLILIALIPISLAVYYVITSAYEFHRYHIQASLMDIFMSLTIVGNSFDYTVVVMALGVLCDAIVMPITRHLLRRMTHTRNLRSLAGYLACNVLLSLILLAGVLVFLLTRHVLRGPSEYLLSYKANLAPLVAFSFAFKVVAGSGGTNLLALFLTAIIFIITIIAVVNSVLWPPLARILNALNRDLRATRRWLLGVG